MILNIVCYSKTPARFSPCHVWCSVLNERGWPVRRVLLSGAWWTMISLPDAQITKTPPERGSVNELKLTGKPGSVEDNHSSRPAIAHWLKQPTRVQYGPYLVNPYLALLRVEFTVPRTVTSRAVRSYRTLSPLPDPLKERPSAVCSLLHWS